MEAYKTLSDNLFKVLVDYKCYNITLEDCAEEFQRIIEEVYPDRWKQLFNGFSIKESLQHHHDPAVTAFIIQSMCKEEE